MGFRDDREAAHLRADALERELAATRAELDALKQGEAPKRPRLRHGYYGVLAGVFCAVAGVAAYAVSKRAERARMHAVLQEAQAQRLRALAEADAVRAREAEVASQRAALDHTRREVERVPRVPVHLESFTWQGWVVQSAVAGLAPETPCQMRGSVVLNDAGDARLQAMRIACGETVVYDAAQDAGPNPIPVGLREGPGTAPERHRYMLRLAEEAAAQAGGRARLDVSTLQHRVRVTRLRPDEAITELHVDDVSALREGPALNLGRVARSPDFEDPVTRRARVTAVVGRAPVARGAQCHFAARAVWEYPENCRLALRCGGTWLYGAGEAGYLTCEVRNGVAVGARDDSPSAEGGDPRVLWSGARVTVSDFTAAGAWSVTLALAP